MGEMRRVLVAGVVLADVENHASKIAIEFASSRNWAVDQQWIVIGQSQKDLGWLPIAERCASREPKFVLLNRLLANSSLGAYEYVVFTDDDIELPPSFLDRYLELVASHDLALAQPARTHDSHIDHCFVEQLDGILARQTRFVEIGPVFSMRVDALRLLTPFDTASPMGWGYDFTWPVTMKAANLRMGIVDAVPVRHALRKPVANYVHGDASAQMSNYLAGRAHLTKEDAFYIVESFS